MLLGLIGAAGTSHAQVTIYGALDLAVRQTHSDTATGTDSKSQLASSGLTVSRSREPLPQPFPP